MPSVSELEVFPPLLFSERESRQLVSFHSCMFGKFMSETIWVHAFSFGRLLMISGNIYLHLYSLDYLFILVYVFVVCVFQIVNPFHLSDQIYAEFYAVLLFYPFNVHVINKDTLFYIFDTDDLCLSLFYFQD